MALVLADRVKETTTTTGTGTVTLAGASAGYRSFATVGNGNTTYYTISGQTTSEWEVGIGTYTTAGTTLSRTTVLSSSNGGSLVVFSAGTKDVFVTYPAGRSVNVDAANTGVSVPQLSATSIINSGLTSGRVVYSTTGGLETDSANLTFNGTTLTANTIGAFTLSGTIAGGGNQINNVIIGTTTPLAGAFTTLAASGAVTLSGGTANGVTYLNASKVLTTGSALTFDGSIVTNTGVGYYVNNTNALLRFNNGAGTRTGFVQAGTAFFYVWSDQASIPMVFGTANTEQMRLLSSGGLGIGTSSPGSRLSVVGGSLATAGTGILAAGALTAGRLVSDGVNATINPIHTYLDSYAYEISAGSTSGYVTGVVVAARSFTGTGGEGVSFWTRSAERMRVDGSGNVGIGTSSPLYKLNVVGADATLVALISGATNGIRIIPQTTSVEIAATDKTGTVSYQKLDLNGSSLAFLISGTTSMTLNSSGDLGIGTTSPGARLDVQNANAYGRIKSTSGTYALFDIDSPASMQPIIRFLSNGVEQSRILAPANEGASQLVFATGTSGTERMRIDASGNVMVGTTASTGSAANTASVVGGIFTTASGTVSAATATATTIFTCPTLVTGLYLVNAQLGNNDPATYGAVSLVGVGSTTLRATSLATGTNITITVSGQTIRSTQTSGLTQTITWTVTRLS